MDNRRMNADAVDVLLKVDVRPEFMLEVGSKSGGSDFTNKFGKYLPLKPPEAPGRTGVFAVAYEGDGNAIHKAVLRLNCEVSRKPAEEAVARVAAGAHASKEEAQAAPAEDPLLA